MKIKHYSIFSKSYKALNSSAVWDDLRSDSREPHYFIPDTFKEYEAKHAVAKLSPVAQWIIAQAKQLKTDTVFSVGSGKGYLEYEIKKYSNLKVIVSDYAESVLKLRSFHFFDNAYQLDINKDDLLNLVGKLIIFSRIDTEFTDEELTDIFGKFYQAGIRHICFVPAELLSVKAILANYKIVSKAIFTGKKITFCGYYRSESLFKKIFMPYYNVRVDMAGSKKVFKLTHKDIVNV